MYLVEARVLRWYLRGMNRCIENQPEPLPADWFKDGMGNPAYDVPPYDRAVAELEGYRYMKRLYVLVGQERMRRRALSHA